MRIFFFGLLICLVAMSSAYANSSDLKEDYRQIEQYRKSKGTDPEYGGSSEDEIIQKWIDIIWNEGWVRKSGFDIHMGNIKRVWDDAQENKKGHALRQLNDFTDLIYADRSVGNVRDEAWTLSPKVNRITHRDNQVLLEFRNAKQKSYRLNIACFQGGIIHISGAESGFFQDSSLVPAKLSVSQTGDALGRSNTRMSRLL